MPEINEKHENIPNNKTRIVWSYESVEAYFMTKGKFDHSPGLITIYLMGGIGKKHFKCFTMWKASPHRGIHTAPYTHEEVELALFSIHGSKAPGM